MNYNVIDEVYPSGIAETGITALISDRKTTLEVPWQISNTGVQMVKWYITSDNGTRYKVTVPVYASNQAADASHPTAYAVIDYDPVLARGGLTGYTVEVVN